MMAACSIHTMAGSVYGEDVVGPICDIRPRHTASCGEWSIHQGRRRAPQLADHLGNPEALFRHGSAQEHALAYVTSRCR